MQNTVKLLVVCFDDEIYAELQKRHHPSLHIRELFDFTKQDQNNLQAKDLKEEQRFGSSTYFRLTNMKIDVAYIFLRYYEFNYMIYTDTDIVMLHPMMTKSFSLLFSDLRNIEMIFTTSGTMKVYPCTGFYAAKRGNFSIDFLGSVLATPDKKNDGDQTFANQNYYKLPAELRAQFHILDIAYYADGNNIGFQKEFGWKAWLFHANWVVGAEAKKQLFQSEQYWFLDN